LELIFGTSAWSTPRMLLDRRTLRASSCSKEFDIKKNNPEVLRVVREFS